MATRQEKKKPTKEKKDKSLEQVVDESISSSTQSGSLQRPIFIDQLAVLREDFYSAAKKSYEHIKEKHGPKVVATRDLLSNLYGGFLPRDDQLKLEEDRKLFHAPSATVFNMYVGAPALYAGLGALAGLLLAGSAATGALFGAIAGVGVLALRNMYHKGKYYPDLGVGQVPDRVVVGEPLAYAGLKALDGFKRISSYLTDVNERAHARRESDAS